MSTHREEEMKKFQVNNENIAKICNSGNSTNHISVYSQSKSNIESKVKVEAEQEQEQEQEIDF